MWNHNYKQVSVNTCSTCLFPLSFSPLPHLFQPSAFKVTSPPPPPPTPLSFTSSDFKCYTSITAGPSLTPLCHSDTTWYLQDERGVSQHSDALIWLFPNWIKPSSSAITLQFKLIQIREAEMWHLWSRAVQFSLCRMCDVTNNEQVIILFCKLGQRITISN